MRPGRPEGERAPQRFGAAGRSTSPARAGAKPRRPEDDLAAARVACYACFAGFFLDDASAFAAGSAWPAVAGLVDDLCLLAHGSAPPLAALAPRPEDPAFAVEYARLFYGTGAATVPLAESCWRDPQGLHCGPPLHAVLHAYARAGFAPAPARSLPGDHLALELAFVHVLAARPGHAPASLAFVDDHLAAWVPACCDAIVRATAVPHFAQVARALRRLVEADARLLERLVATDG